MQDLTLRYNSLVTTTRVVQNDLRLVVHKVFSPVKSCSRSITPENAGVYDTVGLVFESSKINIQ